MAKEDYKLRLKDFVTLSGYDNYLKRNHMLTPDIPLPFFRSSLLPNLEKIQRRANFLMDYNWCLEMGTGIGLGGVVFAGGVMAEISIKNIDKLVQKFF